MKNEILGFKIPPWLNIDMKFLPVKIALFCWYAAAMITSAFIPVFLKHQGLAIAHFAIFTVTSVFFQFLAGLVSAFVADKTGRVKPFFYYFLVLFWAACLCLTFLPSMAVCNEENASFVCYNEEMLQLTAASCQFIRDNPKEFLCTKITVENETFRVDPNQTCKFSVTLFPNLDKNFKTEYLSNVSGLDSSELNDTNSSIKNVIPCISESCKTYRIYDSAHLQCKNQAFLIVVYGIFVVLHGLARSNVFRFIDVIVTDLTTEFNSDFGKQRVFAILGNMVGPALVGILLDKTNGPTNNARSYTLAFVSAIILSVSAAFFMMTVNPKFHRPASKVWKTFFELGKNMKIMLFFVLLFTMGSVAGFQSTYRNWYLKELGASDLLTGVVSGINALYGIPFLCTSKWCIDKVGTRCVFILGLLGHVTYSFAFSAMEKPLIALIIESTTILTYHLFWVAVMQYSGEIAPEGLAAIVKVLAGSLHFNIGKLGSAFVGGYVMETFGGRAAFIVLGSISLAYAFVYGSYHIIQLLNERKIRIASETSTVKEIPEKHSTFL